MNYQVEDTIKIANEELMAINGIILACSSTLDLQEVLNIVMDEALKIAGLESGTLCFLGPDETLRLAVQRETSETTIADLTTNGIKVGECLCGECSRDLKPFILPDREAVLKFSTREAVWGENILFHAAFPLIVKEQCLGVLCVFTRTDQKPSDRSLKLLETVTSQIALAIENAKLYEAAVHHAAALENLVSERTAELKESQCALMNLMEDLHQKTHEIEQVNAKLKEVDQLKSLFIASMSHELRTPLNSVIGFSSILLNEWVGALNKEQKENIATILKSGKHLLAVINDVIDVSMIEVGTIDVLTEDFDLHDVICEAAGLFEQDMTAKGLGFVVENFHQPMHTDRHRLLQCVSNIVSNSMKFTEKGFVHVHARKVARNEAQVSREGDESLTLDNDFVEISVADTGVGVNKADFPNLFSFVRLESPLRARVLGTGLELYLTKKLVTEVLKGKITFASEEHKGSRFAMLIPVMTRVKENSCH